jgi:hypothetical protein
LGLISDVAANDDSGILQRNFGRNMITLFSVTDGKDKKGKTIPVTGLGGP